MGLKENSDVMSTLTKTQKQSHFFIKDCTYNLKTEQHHETLHSIIAVGHWQNHSHKIKSRENQVTMANTRS
jgi:hypothetical protein